MSEANIVEAGSEHLEQVAALFDAYRVFYRQPSDLEGARRFISTRLRHGDSRIFLALEDDGTGLGFVQLFPSFSSVSMQDLWILNDLFVAPDGRRRGIGRALMERAHGLAVETGAKGLILETEADNHAAKRLYEELGWELDGSHHYSRATPPKTDPQT